ncbi:MAG: ADP-ribosylation/Crystallin [Actinomycetia bacterium]|nr:ADP-ribosylation/Crystallin [Actinomycetes bacterium]
MHADEHAAGALVGLAIGDALGMPTQSLPRATIVHRYGEIIDGFHAAPDDQPLAAGLPAGRITDDTEQALLLAELLIDGGGRVDARALAHSLLRWEDDMRRRGSLDLLGPSTKQAVSALLSGAAIEETGRFGHTDGAAMRIAPVGIVTSPSDLDRLVDLVVEVSVVTHNTGIALAGAAAVAAAVSAGIEGADTVEACRVGIDAAERASSRGHWYAGPDVAERIRWAMGLVEGLHPEAAAARIYSLVGTSLMTQEAVPAAFAALAATPNDPWLTCRLAASVGGDCDTIAAMSGAITGACHGVEAFPSDARQTIASVNGIDLETVAHRLLGLRDQGTSREVPYVS